MGYINGRSNLSNMFDEMLRQYVWYLKLCVSVCEGLLAIHHQFQFYNLNVSSMHRFCFIKPSFNISVTLSTMGNEEHVFLARFLRLDIILHYKLITEDWRAAAPFWTAGVRATPNQNRPESLWSSIENKQKHITVIWQKALQPARVSQSEHSELTGGRGFDWRDKSNI